MCVVQADATIDPVNLDGETPLHFASRDADDSECARLLLDAGAAADSRDNDSATPLHEACACGRVETVRLGRATHRVLHHPHRAPPLGALRTPCTVCATGPPAARHGSRGQLD